MKKTGLGLTQARVPSQLRLDMAIDYISPILLSVNSSVPWLARLHLLEEREALVGAKEKPARAFE
jgi:hypothetical protein